MTEHPAAPTVPRVGDVLLAWRWVTPADIGASPPPGWMYGSPPEEVDAIRTAETNPTTIRPDGIDRRDIVGWRDGSPILRHDDDPAATWNQPDVDEPPAGPMEWRVQELHAGEWRNASTPLLTETAGRETLDSARECWPATTWRLARRPLIYEPPWENVDDELCPHGLPLRVLPRPPLHSHRDGHVWLACPPPTTEETRDDV